MRDLRDARLRPAHRSASTSSPTQLHLPVDRWVTPEEFAEHARLGMEELGFAHVEAGPLVRSSYHAGKQFSARRAGARARVSG